METDRGTRPAAPASPATQSANEFDYGAMIELTGRMRPFPQLEDLADDDGTAGIDAEFRRRLRGLRTLRRGERAQALRAARDWRFLALKSLKEKRARERQARFMLWRSGQPPPRQFG